MASAVIDRATAPGTVKSVPTSPDVRITEFTDPACPWAWSAEPFRRRLEWLYGDRVEWRPRMVGLSESAEEYEEKGFTPERQAGAFGKIAREHGMPIDTSERPRMAASVPACRAFVGARLHAPESALALLRALRVRHFAGGLLDDPELLRDAGADAGIDPDELERWSAGEDAEAALREDMAVAREPLPAARVLDDRLANWSGGRRYTCPSYEIERLSDGVRIAIPGFQPFPAYDVVLANLVPDLDRREPPAQVEEVLASASWPLATREVAEVCELDDDDAREALGRVAVERHLGADGLWALAA
jgi:predicted DsbA family dithiol-disulfide isomerase